MYPTVNCLFAYVFGLLHFLLLKVGHISLPLYVLRMAVRSPPWSCGVVGTQVCRLTNVGLCDALPPNNRVGAILTPYSMIS